MHKKGASVAAILRTYLSTLRPVSFALRIQTNTFRRQWAKQSEVRGTFILLKLTPAKPTQNFNLNCLNVKFLMLSEKIRVE